MAKKKNESSKKLVFIKTKNGYILKGKTAEETNTYCRIHAITFSDLEKNLKGNVSILVLE